MNTLFFNELGTYNSCMAIRKINLFEADLDFAYRRINKVEDLKATFNARKNGKAPILNYNIFGKLGALERATINERFSRSELHPSLRRSGVPVTLQERTHWLVELATRAIRLSSTTPKKKISNSMVIQMILSNVLDHSVSKADISSETFLDDVIRESENNEILSAQTILRKIFYVNATIVDDSKSAVDDEGEFVEMFIPRSSFHPVPLLKYLLLGIIEPKLLSDFEFALILKAFNLIEVEDAATDLEYLGAKWSENDRFNLIRESNLNIKEIIESQKKVLDEIQGAPVGRHMRAKGYLDRQLFLSNTKMSYLDAEKIDLFIARFELLKKIMPAAGKFTAKIS